MSKDDELVTKDNDHKYGGWRPLLTIVVIVLPALYVFSTGPAFWLFYHDYLSAETMETLYWPVRKASEATGNWLGWYMRLWVG